jgi:hypothetical protein
MSGRAEALLQRYIAWERSAFRESHINGWAVLAVLVVPPMLYPVLSGNDIGVPLAGSFWLMASTGLTGVYLLDIARRQVQPPSPGGRLSRWIAQVLVLALSAAGCIASGSILVNMVDLWSTHPARPLLLAQAALIVGVVMWGSVLLACRSLRTTDPRSSERRRHGA